jgi:hypothetical protein
MVDNRFQFPNGSMRIWMIAPKAVPVMMVIGHSCQKRLQNPAFRLWKEGMCSLGGIFCCMAEMTGYASDLALTPMDFADGESIPGILHYLLQWNAGIYLMMFFRIGLGGTVPVSLRWDLRNGTHEYSKGETDLGEWGSILLIPEHMAW